MPVALHHDDPNFYLTVSNAREVRPSPPSGAVAALVALEITKNEATAPKSATPKDLGDENHILYLAQPTVLEDN